MKFKPSILILVILLGCSRQATQTESPPDFSKRAQQELAQAYFRLGVSISGYVILKHLNAGEELPNAKTLLRECIEEGIADSKGETLLELP